MKDSVKAAGWTALFTFVALFGVSVTGWLVDLADALSSGSPVPSWSVLASAGVSAAAASSAAVLNFVYRWAQSFGVPLPGSSPSYELPSAGGLAATRQPE